MSSFELKICNLHNAFALGFGWADRVISLVDHDCISRPNFSPKIPHLVEVFDDCVVPGDIRHGEIVPTKEHLQRILDFTKDVQEGEKVLIHCHGGISRSTAVAILVLVQHGASPAAALSKVLAVRKQAWPNELIIRLGDKLLDKNGLLERFIKIWMDSNADKIVII